MWKAAGLRDAMGKYPQAHGTKRRRMTTMKKLNLKKLEKRIAPRYMPF
jgi:hypothetical protein